MRRSTWNVAGWRNFVWVSTKMVAEGGGIFHQYGADGDDDNADDLWVSVCLSSFVQAALATEVRSFLACVSRTQQFVCVDQFVIR